MLTSVFPLSYHIIHLLQHIPLHYPRHPIYQPRYHHVVIETPLLPHTPLYYPTYFLLPKLYYPLITQHTTVLSVLPQTILSSPSITSEPPLFFSIVFTQGPSVSPIPPQTHVDHHLQPSPTPLLHHTIVIPLYYHITPYLSQTPLYTPNHSSLKLRKGVVL